MSKENVRYSQTRDGKIHAEARRGTRGRFHDLGVFANKGAASRAAKRYVVG